MHFDLVSREFSRQWIVLFIFLPKGKKLVNVEEKTYFSRWAQGFLYAPFQGPIKMIMKKYEKGLTPQHEEN